MQKKARKNKTKEEIAAQMVQNARIERMKVLVRLIWPFIEDQKTIYDAQTAINAAGGFIVQELKAKTAQIVVKDLPISLKNEKDSPIKTAVENIINILQTEPAEDAAKLLEKMGSSLGQYASGKYMENPMKVIAVDDFVA